MRRTASLLRATAAAAALFAIFAGAASAAPLFGESEFTLPNGLEVVVVPNHRAPNVTQMVWYKVGAADEERGWSGVAHFLEHLMFKGTRTLKPKEFSEIVARNGGQENAFTSWDYTAFHQTVASDRLSLVMGLEADRMHNLVITDEQLLPERKVILEEWRMRIGNVPSAVLDQQVEAALYLNHPYRIPVLGWSEEMAKLDLAHERRFYDTWYAPNNAILILAGDITVEAARKLALQYYGKIPRKAVPARMRPVEPMREADTTVELKSARVRNPIWSRVYLAPSYHSGDTQYAYALEVLAEVLGGGANSRLHKALVLDQSVATGAGASYDPERLDLGKFSYYVSPRVGTTIDAAAEAAQAVIAKVLADGITADEVDRAKTRLQNEVFYANDSLSQPGNVIGRALTTGSSLADLDAWPDRIGAVTVDQVNAAAHAVLDGKTSVTARLLPAKPGAGGPERPLPPQTLPEQIR
ncbi:MAG TPA: pitrilysin family protein [Aliidongia sp.]|uniref:M16 family metallopeptidase n=1 Tax=Aliidongia sp. TaxID=1914230 RepID=UPI002DDDB747|nr:pitrilysin family protein [Aliidongia sp.]HEV2676476.1 pitrilysin family protein [Aliidongia sp.]